MYRKGIQRGKRPHRIPVQGIRRGADIRIRIQRRFLCRFIRPAAQGIRPGSPRKNETGREETSIIKLYIFELQQTEKTASSRKFRPLARFKKIARIGVESVSDFVAEIEKFYPTYLQTSELSAQLQKNRLIILRGGEFCNFAVCNQ